jgi:hypothetical protein
MGLEIRHGEPPLFGANPAQRPTPHRPTAHHSHQSAPARPAPVAIARSEDSYSKGPIPFADFLYDLNRKHALETSARHPGHQRHVTGEPTHAGACACGAPMTEAGIGEPTRPPASLLGPEPTPRAPIPAADQVQTSARVLHLSRPVGRFIDLYV